MGRQVCSIARRFGRLLRDSSLEAVQDLRSIRWKKVMYWNTPIFIWTSGLVVLVILLGLVKQLIGSSWSACTPDGHFDFRPDGYSYWSRSSFFQINLAYGELTFGIAKFIDVVWDVVVGRIGQTLLAFFSWHVFSLYVTTSMETAPITYNSYCAIFLQSSPSFWSTVSLIRDFTFRKSLHSKIAAIFMITTMAFVLAFPTLASAMTGYTSVIRAYIPDHQNANLIRFDWFQQVLYTIHDGQRIGLSNDTLVTVEMSIKHDPILYTPANRLGSMYYTVCVPPRYRYAVNSNWNAAEVGATLGYYELSSCFLQNNVSMYVKEYGFDGKSNKSSKFMKYDLPPPTLNISAAYFNDQTLFGAVDPSTTTQDLPKPLWMWSNDTYDQEYLAKNGTCQATGNYQWGFSFVQLFCMSIMLLIWTIGTLLMWLRAWSTMQKRGRNTIAGSRKAVMELAAAMRKGLSINDSDLALVTEDNIRRRIAVVEGGSISYNTSLLTKKVALHTSIKAWLMREKWWLLAVILSVLFTSLIWMVEYGYAVCMWSIGPTCGLVFAFCVGSSKKSRGFFILVFTVLMLPLSLITTL